MFDQSAAVLQKAIETQPNRTQFELRSQFGSLIRDVSRYEAEMLISWEFVVGAFNRRGLQYIRLTVDPTKAIKAPNRAISSNTVPRAQDSSTITSEVFGTERHRGLVYSHIRNYAYDPKMRAQYA